MSWTLVIVAGIALAEHWEPWAAIVGGIALLGWAILIANFARTRWHRH